MEQPAGATLIDPAAHAAAASGPHETLRGGPHEGQKADRPHPHPIERSRQPPLAHLEASGRTKSKVFHIEQGTAGRDKEHLHF